jgi:indole-3-glycerol phosphate synthase
MNKDIQVSQVIPAYEEYGAAAISVLTDEEFLAAKLKTLKLPA